MSLSTTNRPTPYVDIPEPGDKILFSPLSINFRVDEDLVNYQEIYNWMIGLGHPSTLENRFKRSGEKSDGTIIIMNSNYKGKIAIKFVDMFPISLSSINFTTENESVQYVSASALFEFTRFEVGLI